MARPRKHKRVCAVPSVNEFNLQKNKNDKIVISVDEYEVLRLVDYQGLTQQECAKQMQVARSTVTAIYDNARYKLFSSIINNKPLEISGGDFEACKSVTHCCGECGKSKCRYCKHGTCENCIGIFHEPGRECYAL